MTFAWKKLFFLGYVVSEKGIEMDETKVNTIKEWPIFKKIS